MAVSDYAVLDGKTARLFRISFSGELAYEIFVITLWPSLVGCLMSAGRAALHLMCRSTERDADRGHVTHAQLDGNSIADTGLGKMASTKKDFIGRVSTTRPAYSKKDANSLVQPHAGWIADMGLDTGASPMDQ